MKVAAIATAEIVWKQEKKNKSVFFRPCYPFKSTLMTHRSINNNAVYANNSTAPAVPEHVEALCKHGRLKEALMEYQHSASTYASLLQACFNITALPEGKLVHAHIIQTGFEMDINLETKLVIMYSKCGSLGDGCCVLEGMPKQNVVSWTSLISAYARHGFVEEALELFYGMQKAGIQPDQFTFASILSACANLADLKHGKNVHLHLIASGCHTDIFVENALLEMYAKCGSTDDALKVFDKMHERDVVSWTSLIAMNANNGHSEEALRLFYRMQEVGIRPDQFAFATIVPTCPNLASLKEVHEDILRSGFQCNVYVGSALIDMYAKHRSIEDARVVFDKMAEGNVVTCNAMIAGYAHNSRVDEALKVFQKMPERNVISWTAMIAGYSQNGYVDEAMMLFEKMPMRNLVSWNAMISGYAQNDCLDEALRLFGEMLLKGVEPNSVTFASVLPLCANFAALQQGKKIHEYIIKTGFQSHILVANTLVDMYAKCGNLEDACSVFNNMHRRDVVSWTSMIVGFALHGLGKEAIQLFEQMRCLSTKPNEVTFIGVLSACSHAGLVEEGWQYFRCMSRDYCLTPEMEHYCCMVNLLGRAGHLNEALDFIKKMPIKPDTTVWGSLLGACSIHTNVKLAESVAEHLFELEPENSAHYVLLSNIYSAAGSWHHIEKVRKMMDDRKVKKIPGCSWIEVSNQVYGFLTGDESHPHAQKINVELERLSG